MQFVRGLHNLRPRHRHCVVTIGNFDGLHLGHQAMLRLLAEKAAQMDTHSCMISFDPLPHEYFAGGKAGPRLMSAREKITTMSELGSPLTPDYLLMLRFDETLSRMSADEFIERILVDALAVRAVVIGDDFRFGRNRQGDYAYLRAAGEKHGFEVVELSTHSVDNMRVSSTAVREALLQDRLSDAERMLGRFYRICGRVAHGDKRGRTIGFPTANIRLNHPVLSLHGVYAVTLCSRTLGELPAVANIGKRPTVNGVRMQLEVHVFDFDRDIYGHNVCIAFHHKIRDEKKFESFELLRQQIETDCKLAREFHRQEMNRPPCKSG
jgi:riboflavin kinase/FMN adenylyltransferase